MEEEVPPETIGGSPERSGAVEESAGNTQQWAQIGDHGGDKRLRREAVWMCEVLADTPYCEKH